MLVKDFEPVMIQVVSVGVTIKVVRRGVLDTVLITSILQGYQNMWNSEDKGTHLILLFIEHKRGNSLTSVGMGSSLPTNADSSTADAEVVNSARNGTRRRRHCRDDDETWG